MNDRVRITKYKNIFSKSCSKNWSREIFFIDSALKTNLGLIKFKQRKNMKMNFYEKTLLLSEL